LKKYPLIVFIFTFCSAALAHTRITTSTGELPKWSTMPITYWINEKGLSQIENGSEFSTVHASFQTWENVPTADIRFSYLGTTFVSGAGFDGLNVVTFADTSTPLGSGVIAVTYSWFRSEIGNDGLIRRAVGEADISFSTALEFSTSGEENRFDLQGVLTHEVGHLLGLDHSGLISSVMVPFGAHSQLDQRTLAYDDIVGISETYPRGGVPADLGQIRGGIRSGVTPVFGAHVVAVNSEGTPLVSALSQSDGTYVLGYLPPGAYRVYVEPLDLPVSRAELGGFYSGLRTDFGTTYSGNVPSLTEALAVNIAAGATATADILTLPRGSSGLNVTRPAFAPRISRGASGTLTIGGEDLTAGVAISASSPSVILGLPTFGGPISSVAPTSARFLISISPDTALGPKNIIVNRGPDTSVLSGAVVIRDPGPSSISVAPAIGPVDGGTAVTIAGTNFRSGAQVYFGGLPATDINVVSPGAITATVPRNSPATVNVVVMNPDGTWGVASRAFMYEASQPSITRVAPLSGPPATAVLIQGANFDARTQNITVRFNGVAARVAGATATVITAIVPYGATTGLVSVTIFDKTIDGPVFTVTPAAGSTNVATARFNFIDASVAGGGTSLTFNSNDDAVVLTSLPFDFSLFRDIYLAGSSISVTTNGFLSLENISASEFQNAALPGQTVTRPSGSTSSIPPSLIAPFWDDLLMNFDSTITTRTVGTAPNRQFVVQWSNMSILDEDGRNQNARLTFEAVLFEGSNDIQFVYHTMTGTRADGSSATVGLQDLKRVTAVQTAFNEPVLSSEQFRTYRFDNGSYSELSPDSTPPSMPVIADEGTVTANRTQLAASWTADDPESGVREFFYAVGTTPGGIQIRPFTSTAQNSIVVTGLNLQAGVTYYFAVKAINGVGLESEISVSDGIRFDSSYQPQIKIIPSASTDGVEFTGLAFLAPSAMAVVLRAYDPAGSMVVGPGIRNPATFSLTGGQQHARLLTELFGLQNFDGWIEAEASGTGLGVFTATGRWDMSTLDGSVARDTSSDFVLFHGGASAILVNPSPRTASVTMTFLNISGSRSFAIPPRGRVITTLEDTVRVQSSEALAAVERTSAPGKVSMSAAAPAADAQAMLVFPHSVIGAGYTSTLTLVNVSGTVQNVSIAPDRIVRLDPNRSMRVPMTTAVVGPGPHVAAIRVNAAAPFGQPSVVGVLDIENESGLVTMGARPAASEFAFPHLANGHGLFTGLAFATGDNDTRITIEIYEPTGGAPKSATITLGANRQLGRLVSELVPGTATQLGGYIRIRSDQPIWAWEIYGSGEVMASGPPL